MFARFPGQWLGNNNNESWTCNEPNSDVDAIYFTLFNMFTFTNESIGYTIFFFLSNTVLLSTYIGK